VNPPDPNVDPLTETMRGFLFDHLHGAPGEEFHYTDAGYSLLGAVIQAVTGKVYADYMQGHWLEPLGMSHSTLAGEEVDPAAQATGYTTAADGTMAPAQGDCDARYAPACALWASCEEMAQVAQLMSARGEVDGVRLLQPETFESMWTSAVETGDLATLGEWYGPSFAEYGLGWDMGSKDGHPLVGHSGGGRGYNTRLLYAPDDDVAVIAASNHDSEGPMPLRDLASDLTTDVLYLLLGIEQE
jgi:CubicO group peptidase (beta-lactamase class C family)